MFLMDDNDSEQTAAAAVAAAAAFSICSDCLLDALHEVVRDVTERRLPSRSALLDEESLFLVSDFDEDGLPTAS